MSLGAQWLAAMRRGDLRAAHAISDVVLAGRDPAEADDPRLPYHLRWVWRGEAFAGRDVLVRCYHGLGDTIQFARYLPPLQRAAASVTVEAQPALLGLLATMREAPRLLPFRPETPLPPRACNIEIMELAHALRAGPLGAAVPYFHVAPPPPGREPGLGVGLCWRAGDWDGARSIPRARLQAACTMPGLRLGSLQQAAEPAIPSLLPPGACVLTTARVIAGLDLVVTVDTMVAHLAGALGRETWLLLKHDCDWRWMEGDRSPWYPTLRLFRQARAGDWSAPLAAVRAALRPLASAAAG